MPLPPPAPRRHQHTRQIEFLGYEREDGLFDIEGHITDVKTYSFENRERGTITAGEPIHDMHVRLTVDLDRLVRKVEVAFAAAPHEYCKGIADAYHQLEGLTVGPGWYLKVRERVGRTAGCTHVTELMGPIATAVMQTLYPALNRRRESLPEGERKPPIQLDGCHAHARTSPVVQERWPEWYVEPDQKSSKSP